MPFDLKAWLNEVFDDDADVKAAVEKSLSGKAERTTKLQSSVMRTADYKRSKDELDRLRTEIEEKDARIDADYAKLGETRADMDKTFQAMKRERDALAVKFNTTAATFKTLAEQNGFDVENLDLDEIDVKNIDRNDKGGKRGVDRRTDVDLDGYTKKEDLDNFGKRIGQGILGSMNFAAEMFDLDREHRDLFGKPLPSAKTIMKEYLVATQKATRAGKEEPSLTQFVEEKFKFEERRVEVGATPVNMTKAQMDAEIKRKAEELAIQMRSKEEVNHGVDKDKPGSVILKKRADFGPRSEEQVKASHERRGVDRAVANYETYERETVGNR